MNVFVFLCVPMFEDYIQNMNNRYLWRIILCVWLCVRASLHECAKRSLVREVGVCAPVWGSMHA